MRPGLWISFQGPFDDPALRLRCIASGVLYASERERGGNVFPPSTCEKWFCFISPPSPHSFHWHIPLWILHIGWWLRHFVCDFVSFFGVCVTVGGYLLFYGKPIFTFRTRHFVLAHHYPPTHTHSLTHPCEFNFWWVVRVRQVEKKAETSFMPRATDV